MTKIELGLGEVEKVQGVGGKKSYYLVTNEAGVVQGKVFPEGEIVNPSRANQQFLDENKDEIGRLV